MRISGWLYLFEQSFCSLCLLLALGLAAELPRRAPFRLVLTALMTTAIAWLTVYCPLPWLRLMLLLPVTALAPLLAWPGVPQRLMGRMAGLSLTFTLLMTGLMRLMSPLPVALILPLIALMLPAVPRLIPTHAPLPKCTTVEICYGMARLTLTGLVDSGNLLRDVITGLPVVLISRRAAEKLTPIPPEGEVYPGMRLMPIRTVAGTSLMTVFRPDSMRILTGRFWRPTQALIGLSPDGYEGFQALVPATLLDVSPFQPQALACQHKEADLS